MIPQFTHTQRHAHLARITIQAAIGVFTEQAINCQYLAHCICICLETYSIRGSLWRSSTLYYSIPVSNISNFMYWRSSQNPFGIHQLPFFPSISYGGSWYALLTKNTGMKISRREPPPGSSLRWNTSECLRVGYDFLIQGSLFAA